MNLNPYGKVIGISRFECESSKIQAAASGSGIVTPNATLLDQGVGERRRCRRIKGCGRQGYQKEKRSQRFPQQPSER